MEKREQWRSRFGFIWAAVGSAIGLGSIWRFPYVVGENGGATFVILYLICLLVVGFPVLMAEILTGRKTQRSPHGAFTQLGKNRIWGNVGKMTILTGFLVSSFYAVIAGWTLGYLVQALFGKITVFENSGQALAHFNAFSQSSLWELSGLFFFMVLSALILYTGVQKGIEKGNKIMMPLLLIVLLALCVKGLTLRGSEAGITFLFKPNWSLITPTAVLMALGQAFFSLSLGQGTMVTYGSYLTEKENLPGTCFPITIFSILIALLAGIAIFTIVFAVGMAPQGGESLMFQTLPLIFSSLPGGYILCLLFFFLLLLAALTSQISALEPAIAYFIDEKKVKRHKAVALVCSASFIMAIPSALSFGPLKGLTLFGMNFFSAILFLCVNILIPLGGLAAVLLVGWRWGKRASLQNLELGTGKLFTRAPYLKYYFTWGMRYIAPLIILLIMLDALGVFKR